MEGLTFRVDRHGLAHICPAGWVTALCGTQGRHEVTRGVLCSRCLELATDKLA